jgi:hypothetical protein
MRINCQHLADLLSFVMLATDGIFVNLFSEHAWACILLRGSKI